MPTNPKELDQNVSPVGWYIGTYQLRFLELGRKDLNDDEARFLVWENTVIVKAESLLHAYDKITSIGQEHTGPYKGGPDGVPVQWQYEGIVELLPIYEKLEDGSEIMWSERNPRKLRNIRAQVLTKQDIYQ